MAFKKKKFGGRGEGGGEGSQKDQSNWLWLEGVIDSLALERVISKLWRSSQCCQNFVSKILQYCTSLENPKEAIQVLARTV
jgi:hypothetical protein